MAAKPERPVFLHERQLLYLLHYAVVPFLGVVENVLVGNLHVPFLVYFCEELLRLLVQEYLGRVVLVLAPVSVVAVPFLEKLTAWPCPIVRVKVHLLLQLLLSVRKAAIVSKLALSQRLPVFAKLCFKLDSILVDELDLLVLRLKLLLLGFDVDFEFLIFVSL